MPAIGPGSDTRFPQSRRAAETLRRAATAAAAPEGVEVVQPVPSAGLAMAAASPVSALNSSRGHQ